MHPARVLTWQHPWQGRWRLLLLIVGSLLTAGLVPAALQAQSSPVLQAVDLTTRYLIVNWRADPLLNKLLLAAGSKVYGACGEAVQGHEVGGSGAGMGVVEAACESAMMGALAAGRINDPLLRQLSQQRSGGGRPDLEKTPYPKTLQSALGL